MDTIAQVIHECETCAAIKQAKRLKPLWYGGRWLKYKYGEAWQIDSITLPQTRQGKRYVLTMVETTTGWLETYPVPHATARNTILGLEKQVLWRHGTPERIESDNGTHFHRITESQKHIGWKRPLRSSSPTINLTLPKPPLHHVSKHLIQTSFKYLQGWRLNHFPGQPVPMLDNPLGEEKFPNIQSKPPLVQLEAISSCPITCYLGEETDPHLSTTSFQLPMLCQVPKKLGGDTARIVDPNWPKGYSIPYDVMLSI
ncbi:hypothetical protein QYF61_004256 [Mycteria americana]|uniref:Integrase catalytic domain-containing protein n=1 Tax=Mycteria americana TaxID=33587 RepID=A0AAN7MSG2_MYCAM|nr:hypothetical protein QYF61_004256 [Mycteria americana]